MNSIVSSLPGMGLLASFPWSVHTTCLQLNFNLSSVSCCGICIVWGLCCISYRTLTSDIHRNYCEWLCLLIVSLLLFWYVIAAKRLENNKRFLSNSALIFPNWHHWETNMAQNFSVIFILWDIWRFRGNENSGCVLCMWVVTPCTLLNESPFRRCLLQYFIGCRNIQEFKEIIAKLLNANTWNSDTPKRLIIELFLSWGLLPHFVSSQFWYKITQLISLPFKFRFFIFQYFFASKFKRIFCKIMEIEIYHFFWWL